MAESFEHVLSQEDMIYLQQLPEVQLAKETLHRQDIVYFSVQITDGIREAMQRIGLDLSNVQTVPLRWIKGDTAPHVDVGPTAFAKTYLVYLNNSAGSLIVDSKEYPIRENAGYAFDEGLHHETIHTGSEPRLLLGPMNEFGCRVGVPYGIHYYNNQADALSATNEIAYGSYSVGEIITGSIGGITAWTIASNSDPGSTGNVMNGDLLYNPYEGIFLYYLYPSSVPCFLAGTRIKTASGYKAVETLESGDKVVTADGRQVAVRMFSVEIPVTNADTAPYCISAGALGPNYPERDLYLTGYHAIKDGRGVWQMPRDLAATNPGIAQDPIGGVASYYHVECPAYFRDDLVVENMVAESFGNKQTKRSPYIWKSLIRGYIRVNPHERKQWWVSITADVKEEKKEKGQKQQPIQRAHAPDRTSWWRSKSSAM